MILADLFRSTLYRRFQMHVLLYHIFYDIHSCLPLSIPSHPSIPPSIHLIHATTSDQSAPSKLSFFYSDSLSTLQRSVSDDPMISWRNTTNGAWYFLNSNEVLFIRILQGLAWVYIPIINIISGSVRPYNACVKTRAKLPFDVYKDQQLNNWIPSWNLNAF